MPQPAPPRRSGAEVDPLHPHHLLIHEGYTYLLSRMDGTLSGREDEGFYDYDTRILSWYRITLNGEEPIGVAAPTLTGERWRGVLSVQLEGGTPEGPQLRQDSLELLTTRRIGLGMVEHLTVANHSMAEQDAEIAVELGADFRDVGEVDAERRQHGTLESAWDPIACVLTFGYSAARADRRLERGLRVRIGDAWAAPAVERLKDGVPADEHRYRLRFPLRLQAHATRSMRLDFESLVDGTWRSPTEPLGGELVRALQARDRRREAVRATRPRIEPSESLVASIVEQAADDILALRNWDLETEGDGWIVNAGVPEFTGFFGRDTMSAGFQSAIMGTGVLRGALVHAAKTQGATRDDEREEQPGRMVHEMRRGPLADLGIRPHNRYYGSHTGASAFVFGLSEHWHWTADTVLLERLRGAAERATRWALECGDLDGDGLLEYVKRSKEGLKNQGWKDSDEAIRYPDGRIVANPIATLEEQGFHALALERMAEILVVLEADDEADRMLALAARFRNLIEDRFWMEDEGFYALAIDPSGEQVRTIASNPLHLLAAGVIRPERARRVADRLFERDLFNGWGIRTLSSEHPSFNPFAYHLGSVWPVESGVLANGLKRYGLDEHVERIVSAAFTAAGHCHMLRLPEVLAGHDRDHTGVPITYPGAKSPQAWSASSTILMLQSLLGLQPFAASASLGLIRPSLPEWIPTLTLRRLKVGETFVDIRFERQEDGSTEYDVLATQGELKVSRVPPPNAEPAGAGERIARAAALVARGRLARAGRIAMGLGALGEGA
jgi:glycogen debranching enzyme